VVIMGAVTWRRFGALVRLATVLRVGLAAAVAVLASELVPVRGGWVVVKIGVIGLLYLGILVLSRELTAADIGMGKMPKPEVAPEEPGSEL
jgi:hypothetical protein